MEATFVVSTDLCSVAELPVFELNSSGAREVYASALRSAGTIRHPTIEEQAAVGCVCV